MATRRNLILGAGAVAAGLYFFPRATSNVSPVGNAIETPGVKNIGNRYAAGGGSDTHQTGVATERGNPDNVHSNQDHPKGLATPTFENTQADQKSRTPSGVPGQVFPPGMYGQRDTKGK